jgi:hypothetical protein
MTEALRDDDRHGPQELYLILLGLLQAIRPRIPRRPGIRIVLIFSDHRYRHLLLINCRTGTIRTKFSPFLGGQADGPRNRISISFDFTSTFKTGTNHRSDVGVVAFPATVSLSIDNVYHVLSCIQYSSTKSSKIC